MRYALGVLLSIVACQFAVSVFVGIGNNVPIALVMACGVCAVGFAVAGQRFRDASRVRSAA